MGGVEVIVIVFSGRVLIISIPIVRKGRRVSESTVYNHACITILAVAFCIHAKTNPGIVCGSSLGCVAGGAKPAPMGSASARRDGGVRSRNVYSQTNAEGPGRSVFAPELLGQSSRADALRRTCVFATRGRRSRHRAEGLVLGRPRGNHFGTRSRAHHDRSGLKPGHH